MRVNQPSGICGTGWCFWSIICSITFKLMSWRVSTHCFSLQFKQRRILSKYRKHTQFFRQIYWVKHFFLLIRYVLILCHWFATLLIHLVCVYSASWSTVLSWDASNYLAVQVKPCLLSNPKVHKSHQVCRPSPAFYIFYGEFLASCPTQAARLYFTGCCWPLRLSVICCHSAYMEAV